MKAIVIALVLASLLLFAAIGCAGTPESMAEAAPVLSAASTEEVSTTTSAARAAVQEDSLGSDRTASTEVVKIGELGERRNPIPVGQEAQVGEWTVKVVDALLDATDLILDENMFNGSPGSGNRYVLVSLEATYSGEESSTFWLDMLCSFVGSKCSTFDPAAVVAPDSIMAEGETLPGAWIAGNLVFEVSSDQVPGGTLMVEQAFAFDSGRLFFALQ